MKRQENGWIDWWKYRKEMKQAKKAGRYIVHSTETYVLLAPPILRGIRKRRLNKLPHQAKLAVLSGVHAYSSAAEGMHPFFEGGHEALTKDRLLFVEYIHTQETADEEREVGLHE